MNYEFIKNPKKYTKKTLEKMLKFEEINLLNKQKENPKKIIKIKQIYHHQNKFKKTNLI